MKTFLRTHWPWIVVPFLLVPLALLVVYVVLGRSDSALDSGYSLF